MYDKEINYFETNIAKLIYAKLSIVSKINFWGNEIRLASNYNIWGITDFNCEKLDTLEYD